MPAPPWKRWYKTARWQALRLSVFQRDLFTCQRTECGHLEGNTALLVCDHIKPHRGDERLFWDDANLQTLCKACHDTIKQREEQATLHQRGVWH
ncbi:HNH endonuclease [Bradyrhizobium barranii subsp. barranii]|uniref:Putative HNH nuclease YajD n=1 Tax=Bradyrhizobium barranii subsp. barranii TaxID=2823807 RepID=A0A939M9V3_9BRAD|nr:HNH endonuclease [Bradyrhizobium barranii]UEM09030.1 HNH endonuclease [Bradyrhizobium barranii subsp. barranii]